MNELAKSKKSGKGGRTRDVLERCFEEVGGEARMEMRVGEGRGGTPPEQIDM